MNKLLKVTSGGCLSHTHTHTFTQTCRQSFPYQTAPETTIFYLSCTFFFLTFLEDDPLLLVALFWLSYFPKQKVISGSCWKINIRVNQISNMAVFGSIRVTWNSVSKTSVRTCVSTRGEVWACQLAGLQCHWSNMWFIFFPPKIQRVTQVTLSPSLSVTRVTVHSLCLC